MFVRVRLPLAPLALLLAAWSAGCARHDAPRGPAATTKPPPARPAGPVIRLGNETGTVVEVTGLTPKEAMALAAWEPGAEEWPKLFAVYVDRAQARDSEPLPLLGSYRVEGGVLRFEPRFPLAHGLAYRAVFHPARLPGHEGEEDRPVETVLRLPAVDPGPATLVEHVYPSRDELPENQLKFYLYFSAPMSRGEAYSHIHLLDAGGKPIEAAFLELGEELWDPAARRFTLFLDPGRIKRGLKPREDLGPVLERGKQYTLVIDRAWSDAKGRPLKETFRKSFRAGPPDEAPPDPKAWTLHPPAAGTKEPLVVTFPRPMEHALLGRMLWVADAQGDRVAGRVKDADGETRWQFTPRRAWQAGTHYLVADTRLEDLAGNSIGRPFEVDQTHPVQREVKAETVRVVFQVPNAR